MRKNLKKSEVLLELSLAPQTERVELGLRHCEVLLELLVVEVQLAENKRQKYEVIQIWHRCMNICVCVCVYMCVRLCR